MASHAKPSDGSEIAPVRLYGARRCVKSRSYEDALSERGVNYVLLDVENDETSAEELRLLYPDRRLNYPTLLIPGPLGAKRVRNPTIRDLDRQLAHAGLHDPDVLHEPQAQRFVRFMAPQDAFVSYSETDNHFTLGHIEVPVEKRGTGLGARFALEVFPLVKAMAEAAEKPARITCTFMRRVAASRPEWAAYFNIPA